MTRELKSLVFSMFYNFFIAIIKLFGGIYFHLESLFADGLHTLSDFITDLVSFLGVKLSKKRPTKSHPFGFGRVEYLTNLFVGMLLVCLAIYIIISGFTSKVVIPDDMVFFLLLTVFVLKLVVLLYLHYATHNIRSQVLITSYRESRADLYSTIIVFFVVLLLKFSDVYPALEYADMIGASLIGIMVLSMALHILLENIMSLLGEAEVDSSLEEDIRHFILDYRGVEETKFTLIKYGDYYQIHVMLQVKSGLSLQKITNLERRIKEGLVRHRSFHIKYPTIYVTSNLSLEK